MEPFALSLNWLALDLRVPVARIAEIVHERRAVTIDTALRLARLFRSSPESWLNLQTRDDLEVARDKKQARIEGELQPIKSAVA